jgi:hypothetical protein
VISIKNRNLIGVTDNICYTTIDLENRFYSNNYATCGLPKKFELNGYNKWRDYMLPRQILKKMCKKFGLEHRIFKESSDQNQDILKLQIDNLKDHNKPFLFDKYVSKSENELSLIKEQLALDALNNWKEITNIHLVPEHVEVRSLYNPEMGAELEKGKIHMWIDMFALKEATINTLNMYQIPEPIDISLRKPKKFQLRIIIFDTTEVILDDKNWLTGEKSSDIYVRAFLNHRPNDSQQTDVHYRSLDGVGNFNWRFIFDFEYIPRKQKIIFKKDDYFSSFRSIKTHIFQPIIKLECWDEDKTSFDDLLGSIELDLSKFVKGAEIAKFSYGDMEKQEINLFKSKKSDGWWPFFKDENKKTITVIIKYYLCIELRSIQKNINPIVLNMF